MSGPLFYVAAIACLAVLAVLVFGFVTFARGGEGSGRRSNKIMQLRVALQFVAVILIVVLAWALSGG